MTVPSTDPDPEIGRTDDRRTRSVKVNWAAVAGALSLLYVVWYIGDLLVLQANPALFNRVHTRAGGVVMRSVFALLFLGIVFHALDGLRRTAIDLRPGWARREVGLRAIVAFLTMAVWIPVTVVLLWPAVRTWFA